MQSKSTRELTVLKKRIAPPSGLVKQSQESLVRLIQTFEERLSQRTAEADHRARQICVLAAELMQGKLPAILAPSHNDVAGYAYVIYGYEGKKKDQCQQNQQ